MLSDFPMTIVLLAPDLTASKEFDSTKIGLTSISDTPTGVTYKTGGDTHLVISKSTVGTKDEQARTASA